MNYRIYTQTDGSAPELVLELDDRELALDYVADHVVDEVSLPDPRVELAGNVSSREGCALMWVEAA